LRGQLDFGSVAHSVTIGVLVNERESGWRQVDVVGLESGDVVRDVEVRRSSPQPKPKQTES
jgi:hypothetical protein